MDNLKLAVDGIGEVKVFAYSSHLVGICLELVAEQHIVRPSLQDRQIRHGDDCFDTPDETKNATVDPYWPELPPAVQSLAFALSAAFKGNPMGNPVHFPAEERPDCICFYIRRQPTWSADNLTAAMVTAILNSVPNMLTATVSTFRLAIRPTVFYLSS